MGYKVSRALRYYYSDHYKIAPEVNAIDICIYKVWLCFINRV